MEQRISTLSSMPVDVIEARIALLCTCDKGGAELCIGLSGLEFNRNMPIIRHFTHQNTIKNSNEPTQRIGKKFDRRCYSLFLLLILGVFAYVLKLGFVHFS